MKKLSATIESYYTDYKNYWPQLISILVLSIILLIALFHQIYAVINLFTVPQPSANRVVKLQQTQPVSLDTWHLFGKKPPIIRVEGKWILRGIILGTNNHRNLAIISNGEQETVYSEKDLLMGDVSVYKILSDRVLLLDQGNIITLQIPLEEAPAVAPDMSGRE